MSKIGPNILIIPTGVLNPFSYIGSRSRTKGTLEAPQVGLWRLLQVPSMVRYLRWKQASEQSGEWVCRRQPDMFAIICKCAGDTSSLYVSSVNGTSWVHLTNLQLFFHLLYINTAS